MGSATVLISASADSTLTRLLAALLVCDAGRFGRAAGARLALLGLGLGAAASGEMEYFGVLALDVFTAGVVGLISTGAVRHIAAGGLDWPLENLRRDTRLACRRALRFALRLVCWS